MSFAQVQTLYKWDTPCAQASELYFHRLLDSGERVYFAVTDRVAVYEFCFEQFGPYQVADEAHVAAYQTPESRKPDKGPGTYWTYTVIGSPWAALFNQTLLELYLTNYTHYCIMTYDGCLDILAAQPPTISVFRLPTEK
jgi:hypothetical protein